MKAVFVFVAVAAMFSLSEAADCTVAQLSKCDKSNNMNQATMKKEEICMVYKQGMECLEGEKCTLSKEMKDSMDKGMKASGIECSYGTGSAVTTSLLMFIVSIFITIKNYL